MENSGSKRFWKLFTLQNFKTIGVIASGILTAAAVTLIFAVTAFYYASTPSAAVVITAGDFPTGLATNFTKESLNDHVVGRLQTMIKVADSGDVVLKDATRQSGLGAQAAKETVLPIRALSNAPAPFFDKTWNGWSFNFCRSLGTTIGAKGFIQLGVIGVPKGGWRLTGYEKVWPHFLPTSAGSAPKTGEACGDLEGCADDLTEQILAFLDSRRLLNFYIKANTDEANQRILELYGNSIPPDSLQADDLVAWGNAFYGLGRHDEARLKYEAALKKDAHSCAAQVGLGFVYDKRPHENHKLADLKVAEQYLRQGISCNPANAFTHTSLCHALVHEWKEETKAWKIAGKPSKQPEGLLLTEAQQHCEKALDLNPQLVVAGVNLGYVLYWQGKNEEAFRHLERLRQRFLSNSFLLVNYGYLEYLQYVKTKQTAMLDQAIEHTFRSLTLERNNFAAANNLGYFHYEKSNFAQALEFWGKANLLNENDADSLAGQALGKEKSGDRKAAVALLCKAISIDGNYRKPAYLKEYGYWSDRAATDLTKLIKLLPKTAC
jgi:tetratricopeptide (TPR) repeat protein